MPEIKKINLVSANMGYGHQRAAYPLLQMGGGEIITVNDYDGIPEWEKDYWIKNLSTYEKISRFKKFPIVGGLVFSVMDYFQRIKPFYPERDLSKPTFQQLYFQKLIKKGLGKDLMDKLSENKLPMITTFFVAMYMAEGHNYNGDIYSVVCDADVSRAWAPINPKKSRVKFLVPNKRVKERLMMYGVKEENIYITGFPLPLENIGEKQSILKEDLANRIANLDIDGLYREKEKSLIKKITPEALNKKSGSITITFAVGGAGAQKEIGVQILKSFKKEIKNKQININLIAGIREEVKEYFDINILENNLSELDNVEVVYDKDKVEYFRLFNKVIRKTDILWTKPSELSFYSGLGLPIMMSETVGSQEDFNKKWLLSIGAGIESLDPNYADEWLPDMLSSGRIARAAMDGYLNTENQAVNKIEEIINKK